MAKEKEKKRNITHELYFNMPMSNLPGIDNKLVIPVDPIAIREDGYILPTEPMTMRRWKFLYFISFFIPIRRISRKNNPFDHWSPGSKYAKKS